MRERGMRMLEDFFRKREKALERENMNDFLCDSYVDYFILQEEEFQLSMCSLHNEDDTVGIDNDGVFCI